MKKTITLIFFLLCIILIKLDYAQTYDKLYVFGAQIQSTLLSPDNNIYGAGRYIPDGRLYLIKQSLSGQLLWQKFYNISSGSAIIKTASDGNFFVLCGANDSSFSVMKIDPAGSILTSQKYTSSVLQSGVHFFPVNMEIDSADNIYLLSISFSMIKLDSSGTVLWAKEWYNSASWWGSPYDETNNMIFYNGNILVTATSTKDDGISYYYKCFALHTISTNGSLLSSLFFADTSYCYLCPTIGGDVIPLNNGRLIYSTKYASPTEVRKLIMNIDMSGQVFWTTSFKAFVTTFTTERDHTFIFNNAAIYLVYCPNQVYDLGLTKFDTSGNHLWTKGYGTTVLNAYPSNMLTTPDNNIILSGQRHYLNDQAFIDKIDTAFNMCNTFLFNPGAPINNMYPIPDVPNTYTVSYFAVNTVNIFVTDSSSTYQLSTCFTTSIHNTYNENIYSISPNPAFNELAIDNGELRIESLEIYNTLGKRMYETHPNSKVQRLIVDVTNFSSGIYFVRIRNGGQERVAKFVKQ